MKYRQLGSTGMQVSEICMGTWQLSGAWGDEIEPAVRAVGRAFDLGINFFDTAYAYGVGAAEQGLARGLGVLMKSHRDELVIATKGGLEVRDDVYLRNSDPAWLRHTLEHSLRSLGTDYVDVYFIHWPDPLVPYDETAGVVQGFIDEGLVRHAGVSNFSVAETEAYRGGGSLGVHQPAYSLLRREVEADLLPYCQRERIGVMAWGAVGHGLLTGAIRSGQSFNDWRAHTALFRGERLDELIGVVDELAQVADELGCTLAQLAIAWVLASPASVIPIVGALEPAHVEANVGAVEVELTPDVLARLDAITADVPPADPAVPIPARDAVR